MERVFTKDVGNHPFGKIANYPMGVWRSIALSAHMDLDDFTKQVESAVSDSMRRVSIARNEQPSDIKRGRGRPRKVSVGT